MKWSDNKETILKGVGILIFLYDINLQKETPSNIYLNALARSHKNTLNL